jgi:hypothetical protein
MIPSVICISVPVGSHQPGFAPYFGWFLGETTVALQLWTRILEKKNYDSTQQWDPESRGESSGCLSGFACTPCGYVDRRRVRRGGRRRNARLGDSRGGSAKVSFGFVVKPEHNCRSPRVPGSPQHRDGHIDGHCHGTRKSHAV